MNICIISILLICCGTVIIAESLDCPPKEKLTCSCTDITGTSIICNKESIQSDEDLKSNLKALKEYEITKFTLKDIALNKAEEDTFQGQFINHMVLDNVTVLDDSFKGGRQFFNGIKNSLHYLEILHCLNEGTVLNHFKVSYLQNLEYFLMEKSKIEEFGNDWFPEGPSSLKYLMLIGNGIEKLGDRAFSSLTGLNTLWITSNSLSEITRDMFPQKAPHLRILTLAMNKITHFPTDVFHGMPNLEVVNLSNNLITTLDKHIDPNGLKQIVKFTLTGNPIRCDQDIKWLCDERRADIDDIACDSPEETKGKLLSAFCEMEK